MSNIEIIDTVNTVENRKLLYSHLTNYLKQNKGYSLEQSKEAAKQLMKKHELNLFGEQGLAVWLSSKSIEYFCLHFLSDVFVPKDNNTARNLGQVHYDIWNELQSLIVEDLYNMEEFILPRGSAKSTIINKAISCFLHCHRISRYSLIIGKTKQDASDFIEDVKKFMGFDTIKMGFGNLINRKNRTINQQELELDNDTMIRAYGWETSVRGTSYSAPDGIYRPMIVICDDILNENDIKTDNAKENAVNKFYKEILEVGDDAVFRNGVKIKLATKFLILGTPLAQDCFINTIRKDPQFKVFRRSVVDFNIDDYFENNDYWQQFKRILFNTRINQEDKEKILDEYYFGNIDKMEFPTIWEKYNCAKLAIKYFTKRTAFLQELMCDCEGVGEKWFKSLRKISEKELQELKYTKSILVCDPASTVTRKSDYTAFVVGGYLADNGFHYIRKGIIDKLSFNDYCAKVVELLKEYEDVTHCVIERNTYNSSDVTTILQLIELVPKLKARHIQFINKQQTKNKDVKISQIIDPVNAGSIIFNESDDEFNQQILDFSGQATSLHDDSPDAVAEYMNNIGLIETTRQIEVFDRRLLF